ncbi:glycosyltransferase [[Ruminococcus] torques]|uniref:glycosyltransferase n=1 Tax=[Ruminococcus] torques TaxID=33039 RepID=UPI0025A3A7B1|nr:glycosyltransferase [[Ruminococcus] torques]MDM8235025.1 glycosyltransferase [[Ruminococcus] torques]
MDKVYITSLHLLHGGVEMAITLLANALVKRGFNVEILCIYNLGDPAYSIDKKVKITYLSDVHPNREEFYKAVKEKNVPLMIREGLYSVKVLYLKNKVMADAIKRIDKGVIISTRNEHSVLLSKYGRREVRKVAQLHHDHKFEKRLIRDFKKKYTNIDYFVLLTEKLKDEVKTMMKENTHTKCVVIPNFLSDMSEVLHSERKRQVLAVGRLHSVKGFERLIKIWKRFDAKDETVLKIIGDGQEKESLQNLIDKYCLQEKVIMTGELSHEKVMEEMHRSICYVMTSYSEAFPFVLIEAMAGGLPVVAYDVRVGPAAIVQNGESGFLIPDGNEELFIDKLRILCQDDKLREQMSKNAVQRSREFSEDSVMKKWLEILKEK